MNKYRIGLEITEKNLRLAVVGRQENGWRLLETVTLPVSGMPQTLQQAHRNIGRAIRQAILSFPYDQVLMKEIRVDPTLTGDEIYQYLQQQAPALFGKSAQHWFLDFEPCLYAMNIAQHSCYRAVAAPREKIAPWLQICRKSGLQVHAVDIDVLAMARLLPTLEDYQPDHPQALLWVKPTEILFIVAKTGHLIYAKRTAYLPTQAIEEILTAQHQFFNGLFPQYLLANTLLINENSSLPIDHLNIKIAALNSDIWQIPTCVQPYELCSLGLAIYDY